MRACQLALLSSFLLAVSAKVTITNPVEGTVWELGKKNTVTWTHEDSDKGEIDINLIYTAGEDPEEFEGDPIVTQKISDVTKPSAEFDLTNVDKSKFPPSSDQFFIRFGDVKGSYSHLFTVKGGTGSASSSGTTSSKSSSGSSTSGSSSPTSGSTSGGPAASTIPTGTIAGNNTISSPSSSVRLTPVATNKDSKESGATKITASFVSIALAVAAFLF